MSHFPPGTSKWNKVEYRLLSFISINWRGRPLRSYETVIKLMGLNIEPDDFHGDWNYVIRPRPKLR